MTRTSAITAEMVLAAEKCRRGIFALGGVYGFAVLLFLSSGAFDGQAANVCFFGGLGLMTADSFALIFVLFRFVRICGRHQVWLGVPLAWIPVFGMIGYVIAYSGIGPQLARGRFGLPGLPNPPARAASRWEMGFFRALLGGFWLLLFVLGVGAICWQWTENGNLERLRKSGQRTSGALENVTVQKLNSEAIGYTFFIRYVGGIKPFKVNKDLYEKHVQGDGHFSHHSIEVVYLPDKPEIAELPEMLEPRWMFYWAGFVIFLFLFIFGKQRIKMIFPRTRKAASPA